MSQLLFNLLTLLFLLGGPALKGTVDIWHSPVAARGGDLFRRTSNLGEFSGLQVTMDKRTVLRYAEEAGIGLDGVRISINRQTELVGSGLFGSAGRGNRITLFPDAFRSPEELIRTLGHERTHLMQFQLYVIGNAKGALRSGMENAAYGIEDAFVGFWRGGR